MGFGEEIEGVGDSSDFLVVHISSGGGGENSMKRVPMGLWEMGRNGNFVCNEEMELKSLDREKSKRCSWVLAHDLNNGDHFTV